MNAKPAAGLGEPEITGKRELFKPPRSDRRAKSPNQRDHEKNRKKKDLQKRSGLKRIRITTKLTNEALEVIQKRCHDYRLKTGKVLPVWKAISDAIEGSEKHYQEGHE